MDDLRALGHQVINLAKARIMSESLQRCIGNAQRLGKQGQLLMHQLIKQCVGFRGNANRDAILLGGERQGDQICHRFANAGARLNGEVARRCQGMVHRHSHFALLFARLVFLIQLAQQAFRRERLGNLFVGGKLKRRGIAQCGKRLLIKRRGGSIGIHAQRSGSLGNRSLARSTQAVGAFVFLHFGNALEHALGVPNAGIAHVGNMAQQRRGHVVHRRKKHAIHQAGGRYVVVGTVG